MINLGVIDIILLVILLATLGVSSRRRDMLPFYAVLIIFLLIELERLVPGTMKTIGDGIRGIDTINASLPHVSIQPIITIQK